MEPWQVATTVVAVLVFIGFVVWILPMLVVYVYCNWDVPEWVKVVAGIATLLGFVWVGTYFLYSGVT